VAVLLGLGHATGLPGHAGSRPPHAAPRAWRPGRQAPQRRSCGRVRAAHPVAVGLL